MTVKLDLTPEAEASLAAHAHARGLTLEAYLDQVLQNAVASTSNRDDEVFVVKHGLEWAVKKVHIERARDVFPTQAEAIERARELAAGGEIHVQKRPAGRKSLAQLFAESPFKGLDLKFERDPDTGRPVTL